MCSRTMGHDVPDALGHLWVIYQRTLKHQIELDNKPLKYKTFFSVQFSSDQFSSDQFSPGQNLNPEYKKYASHA